MADDPVHQIAALTRGFSIEATLPSAQDIDSLRGVAPAGMPVFLSAVPAKPLMSGIEPATHIRRIGFEPVPHLVARNFPDRASLDEFLARMSGEAGVTRALVLAGDLHDLLEQLHEACNDYQMCRAIFDAEFAAADWIDREDAEIESAAEEELRARKQYRAMDEESARQQYASRLEAM